MSKLTVYELANDVSNQLHLLKKDINAITIYIDDLVNNDRIPDSEGLAAEEIRRVYRQINSAYAFASTLYNEYQALAAETINEKD